MTIAATRALLQVLYREQHGSPRTPNALRELLGLIDVRAGGEGKAPNRKTLDIHGAAYLADDPVGRGIKIDCGGDVVIEPAISGTLHNYTTTLWDDASIVLFTLTGATSITGFDAFSCRRWQKLIYVVGGGTLTIEHAHTGSKVDNRIHALADVVITTGQAAWLVRDFTDARWHSKATA